MNSGLEGKPTNPEVQNIIKQTADDMGASGYDTDFGYGRINANQAILLALAYTNKSTFYYASGYNNNHTIERGYFGKLHEVFHSGGEIFYRRSSNNGITWELTKRLSSGNGANDVASIVAADYIGYYGRDVLCTVWQRKLDSRHYEIWYTFSSTSGDSWTMPAIVPGCSNIYISYYQSGDYYGPGPTPVVASYIGIYEPSFLLVYAAYEGLHYRYALYPTSGWTIPANDIIPESGGTNSRNWYPCLSSYNSKDSYQGQGQIYSKVNLTYDDRFSNVYSQFYSWGASVGQWSSRQQVSAQGTSNNRVSSIAVGYENSKLVTWMGWNGSYYTIRFRQGLPDGSWSSTIKEWLISDYNSCNPVLTYYNRGGSNPYGIDILWNTSPNNQIRQKKYGGYLDFWVPADPNTQLLASNGVFPNITHERQNTVVPMQTWTDQSTSPIFTIQYNSFYLPKENVLSSGKIKRIALIGDISDNSGLSIELSQPEIKLSNGEIIPVKFKEYGYSEKLDLSLSNLFDYLQTEELIVPEDAETISFSLEIKSFKPDTLSDGTLNANKSTLFENISINLLAKDGATHSNLASLGNQDLNDKSGIHNFSKSYEVSARDLKSKSVFLIPNIEVKGSFNNKDLRFSLINVSIERPSDLSKDLNAEKSLPTVYLLEQNYPNPFNPVTQIRYSIKEDGLVKLQVFDIRGSEVALLVNEEKPAGFYESLFDASTLSSGIYFYKLQAGSFVETKKMILLK